MKAPPQVVFCTHDSPHSIGGPFTWLRRLLPLLREAGVDSRVLALTHFGGTGPVVEALKHDGFDVAVTDCPDRTEDAVRWVLAQFTSTVPKVFVPNFVVPALFASRWLREAGSRTIGVLHSDDDYYRAIQQEFVLTNSPYRLTDIVTVSESLQSEVVRRCPPNGVVATYIPYGVEIPGVTPRPSAGGLKIAYVGRLAEQQKRIGLVAEALVAACQEVPGTEAVIFGDGPDRVIVERVLATQTAGIPVKAAGPLKHEEVQNRLLHFDIIILLSDYEGLPISLLEAMACGCVPVCRQMQSGIPQLVRHEETGLLVSEKASDVVAAVRRLSNDRLLLRRLAAAARSVVISKFSEVHMMQMWVSFLRHCQCCSAPRSFRVPRNLPLPPARAELECVESRLRGESGLRRSLRRLRIGLGAIRRRL